MNKQEIIKRKIFLGRCCVEVLKQEIKELERQLKINEKR